MKGLFSKFNKKQFFKLILILSLIGVLDTVILTYGHYSDIDKICVIGGSDACKTVQNSEYSVFGFHIFGIEVNLPVSLLGLSMYLLIFYLTINLLKCVKNFESYHQFLKILVDFALAFSIIFTLIQAFILKAFCFYCVLSALNILAIFILVYFSEKLKK